MALLVGLGNPGPKYDATRHNVGFALADSAARALGSGDWKTQGKALLCKAPPGSFGSSPLLIAKPQTFMNLSGEAVQSLMAFYKIPPAEVVVVTDDVTLPLGSIRVRASGGHVFADFQGLLETGLTKGWELAATRYNRRTEGPA
jgi:PTH1 family peptidyl-tRNA hydrolase